MHNTHLQNPIVVVIVQMWLTVCAVYFCYLPFWSDLLRVAGEHTCSKTSDWFGSRWFRRRAETVIDESHGFPLKNVKTFLLVAICKKTVFDVAKSCANLENEKFSFCNGRVHQRSTFTSFIYWFIYSWEINLYVLFHI